MHSRATGDSATREGRTCRLASRLSPTASNSLVPGGKAVPVAFTCSNRFSGARLTTNSRVASTLRRESLRPTEVNWTIGGSVQATVKNECGAKLSTPASDTVETHAMGRGTTTAVSRR